MEDVEANRLSIEFMSDIPIEDFKDDLFNRHPFAIQIAEEIINRTNTSSIVIGIYGEWGEGKTSALNLIRKELEKSDRIIVVKFNPWLFNDESQLVMMFFSILIETLKILGKKSEIGKFITKYAGIAGCVNISVPGISIKPEKLMNEMGKIISGNDPEKLKYKIGEELKNNNKRVVVIMDDIDRLDKNEIQSVFKLVKLTADFDNICYLLSFDDNRVATALCEKYGKDKNDIPAGHNFIEKIVQVPLRIPKIDKISLRHYFENNIIQTLIDTRTSWKKEDLSSFGKYFIDSLEIKVTTPRICKRFANALRYKLIALKDEVGIVDLITLTCIEVFYPKVYNTIRNHPELFSGNPSSDFLSNTEYLKPLAKEIIEQATSDLATQEKTQITRLIRQLFPQISILLEDISLGNTENNWEEEWTRNRRIASRYYFHRFFSYSIPKFDISDTIVRNLIRDIKSKNINEATSMLRNIVNLRNAEVFIDKLRGIEKEIHEDASIILAQALSRISDLFDNPVQIDFFLTTMSQSAILIRNLLKNVIDIQERFTVAQEIIKSANPLPFADECFRWIRVKEEPPNESKLFSEENENLLGKLIVERVKEVALKEVFYTKFGEASKSLLYRWYFYGDQTELRQYLKATFEKEISNILEFLKLLLPITIGMGGKIGHGDFDRDQYDNLKDFVDPELVFEKLKTIYGDELLIAEKAWTFHGVEDENKRIALEFSAIHNQVLKEKEKSINSEKLNDGEATT